MARISQEELNSYLWGTAELLRSHIDAGNYKQYVFPLLFFKRLSDVYDEESAKAVEEFGDPEAADWGENHRFVLPDGARWSDVRNVGRDVGKAIVDAFHAIESANHEKLEGIFGDGAWTNKRRLPDELLKDMIEHLSSKTLSIEDCPEDELGQGYEYLVRRFADDSGHTAQEFYTNRTVVHLMSEMLEPRSGESVYDPTCGTAGMLISCVAYLQSRGREWRNLSLWGQEVNQLTSDIARMNLFLHGIGDFHIANDDTLARPAFLDGDKLRTFSIVLANPPYSIKQWDREAFSKDPYGRNFLGAPPQGRADYAFIQHILRSMDPETGRCAILLPHGVLFRIAEKAMRKRMVELDLVDAVVDIGKNLFYNSAMEATVLVCRSKKDAERKGKVLFIDARNEVTRQETQSFLEPEHIEKIADCYLGARRVPGFSAVASLDDIAAQDFDLSVENYVRMGADKRTEPSSHISAGDAAGMWDESADLLDDSLESLFRSIGGQH